MNNEITKKKLNSEKPEFLFGKENYTIMFIGLALVILGFMAMIGGKSVDPHVFNYSEIYSFRRITLSPILIVAGFLVEIYAIMRTPKINN